MGFWSNEPKHVGMNFCGRMVLPLTLLQLIFLVPLILAIVMLKLPCMGVASIFMNPSFSFCPFDRCLVALCHL